MKHDILYEIKARVRTWYGMAVGWAIYAEDVQI